MEAENFEQRLSWRRLSWNGAGVLLFVAVLALLPGFSSSVDAASSIYWADILNGKIQRANPDGSNAVELVTGLSNPTGLALDVANGHMYWADDGTNKIQRADLDGSNVTNLVSTGISPFGLALDVANGKMYWADTSGAIFRAGLGGTAQSTTAVP